MRHRVRRIYGDGDAADSGASFRSADAAVHGRVIILAAGRDANEAGFDVLGDLADFSIEYLVPNQALNALTVAMISADDPEIPASRSVGRSRSWNFRRTKEADDSAASGSACCFAVRSWSSDLYEAVALDRSVQKIFLPGPG
jgi:hypothetical protein